MIQEFAGDVASDYARFRRGYPAEVFDLLAAEFPLGRVLDLGCGTGQLTVPMAARAGAVIGMDPSPDMLAHARGGASSTTRRPTPGAWSSAWVARC
ncbi:class I SAM-dependent methyltransferase [Amycolatopsis sp. ATCC 39116]|uniref:methyltransferase domain-containing protein n=1 Tax=Amycolatopsis sp. (strain ATCC 39116 / 75iv2) TaxID=385957 RepID=UPI000368E8A3|nr:class I SAM-dependent methyltransferase [Amycolatopsis sp. ATCC 39116]